jgi:hypothetical protein
VAVVFLGDQLSVPTKQSIRCNQTPDLESPFSANRFGLDRESATLLIGKLRRFSSADPLDVWKYETPIEVV